MPNGSIFLFLRLRASALQWPKSGIPSWYLESAHPKTPLAKIWENLKYQKLPSLNVITYKIRKRPWFGGPWIPGSKLKNTGRFDGPWISESQFNIRTDLTVRGYLVPYFKIRTDSVVHKFLDPNWKIRIDLAVLGYLETNLKIRNDSAVHESLVPNLQNTGRFGGPWIPALPFKKTDRFGGPFGPRIPLLYYKIRKHSLYMDHIIWWTPVFPLQMK